MGPVAKLADAGDLKSPALVRVGSNPTGVTKEEDV